MNLSSAIEERKTYSPLRYNRGVVRPTSATPTALSEFELPTTVRTATGLWIALSFGRSACGALAGVLRRRCGSALSFVEERKRRAFGRSTPADWNDTCHATNNTCDVIAYNVTRGIRLRVCEGRPGPAWPRLDCLMRRICARTGGQQPQARFEPALVRQCSHSARQRASSEERTCIHQINLARARAHTAHTHTTQAPRQCAPRSTCRPIGWCSACGRLTTQRAAGARTAGGRPTAPAAAAAAAVAKSMRRVRCRCSMDRGMQRAGRIAVLCC